LKKTLILGIGNEILTDDGIGPRLVSELEKEKFTGTLHFQNAFLGGLEILELIQGYQQVIFIDAIISLQGIPGTVYHFTPEDFQETLHLSNLHDANFLVALELGRKMGMHIPEDIHIIAIEIIEDRVFSNQFSKEIEEMYPAILLEVTGIMNLLIKE